MSIRPESVQLLQPGDSTSRSGPIERAVGAREQRIIFSPRMVLAIRAGEKTETRRLLTAGTSFVDGAVWKAARFASLDLTAARVDPGPSPAGNAGPYLRAPRGVSDVSDDETWHRIYPRLACGELLWVREGFAIRDETFAEALAARARGDADAVLYRADGTKLPPGRRWYSPLLMPRGASRIELRVHDVRVEPLHAIDAAAVRAEGIALPRTARGATIVRTAGKNPPARYLPPGRAWSDDDVLVAEYASGWDTLHPKTGRWAENPWVIVTRFEVVDGLATEATDAR